MPNHLEQLIGEYFEHDGFFVRRNVRVGKLPIGGHKGELDVVAYHPVHKRLIHVEPSLDGDTWEVREVKFRRKFDTGREYMFAEVFPFVAVDTTIEQWAVLYASATNHRTIGGGQVVPAGELYRKIAKHVIAFGPPATNAIPENFPLLRTMQCALYFCVGDDVRAMLCPEETVTSEVGSAR